MSAIPLNTLSAPQETSAPPLREFARDVHSQFGEDGILERIFEVLDGPGAPSRPRWCVEFGAWDGVHLSNTRHLIETHRFHGILIEASSLRYADLLRNADGLSRVQPLRAFVEFEGPNRLDELLKSTDCPKQFDLLSIDVDGNDYHIWDSVEIYRPRIVVIEFNPTIPYHVRFVQPRRRGVAQGSSIRSLVELGERKGYRLAAVTTANAIFVTESEQARLGLEDATIEALMPDHMPVTYLFQGYDGTIFLAGNKKMIWHQVPIRAAKLQQIPGWLRRFPDQYGSVRRAALALFRRLHRADH